MSVDAIIFDKDGTLFDFQATWTAPFLALIDSLPSESIKAEAARHLGIDRVARRFLPESLVIASTGGQVAAALAPFLDEPVAKVEARLNRELSSVVQVTPVALRPCLQALKLRFKLGLVTNDAEAPARAHLEQYDVLGLFDFIAGFDSGHGAKPAPGQLLAFAKATGAAPERTLMVGDSAHDLLAGQAAGMVPVGVLTGVATEADLRDMAEVVLPDIGHLKAWIDGRA